MRQLTCDARNIRHSIVERDGEIKLETFIEAILTVMTRKMQFSGSGLVQTEDLETMRFEMTVSGAKRLVKDIERWIEDAETERAKLSLNVDDAV